MRVVTVPAADDGSAECRIKMPTRALQELDCDVELLDPNDCQAPVKAAQADVIVFNRPHNPAVLTMMQDAYDKGIAVVVDVDDHFDALDRDHAMYWRSAELRQVMHQACQLADLVTVTTPKLAEVYGYGHSVVIPNYIPAAWCEQGTWPGIDHPAPLVGWTGTVKSHPHDLEVVGNGVRKALEEHGGRFCVIGSPDQVGRQLGIRSVLNAGFATLEEYPSAYAGFDVAIVPLADTAFNEAKSWLKGLEAAALGVPFVASPTAQYVELEGRGAGLLAQRPSDWRREIGALLQSEQMRADVAGRGRETARTLTIETHCEKYWNAWTMALLNRRAGVPVR